MSIKSYGVPVSEIFCAVLPFNALDAAWDADGGLDAAFTYGRVVNTDNFEQPESEPFKLTDRSAAFFATGNVAVSRARLAGACALLPPQQHEQQCGGLRKYPDGADAGPVSYTHLTLPTKRIV